LKNVTSEPMARRRWEATKDAVNENCRISILATAGSIGIARHPIVVGPVEVDPAKLEFTFHSAQLRVGDRLDQVLQVAVDPPYCGPRVDANAFSTHPAKPITAPLVASITKIRSLVRKWTILHLHHQLKLASYWSEDADDGIGNRGAALLSLIATA
jgi:hypothetical protein